MPSCGRRTRILHGEGSQKGPDLGGKVVPMGANTGLFPVDKHRAAVEKRGKELCMPV